MSLLRIRERTCRNMVFHSLIYRRENELSEDYEIRSGSGHDRRKYLKIVTSCL